MKLEDFVGKEVQLYPGDSMSKWGILEEVSDKGYLFKITRVGKMPNTECLAVGDSLFISHSTPLSFKCNEQEEYV